MTIKTVISYLGAQDENNGDTARICPRRELELTPIKFSKVFLKPKISLRMLIYIYLDKLFLKFINEKNKNLDKLYYTVFI